MASALTCSAFLLLVCYLLWHASTSQPRPVLLRDAVDSVVDRLVSDLLPSFPREREQKACLSCSASWTLPSGSSQWPTLVLTENWPGPSAGHSSALTICNSLAGKRLLFVGPDATYHLHLLWLSSLEAYEGRPHRCLGRDYCTFHHICIPAAGRMDYAEELVGRKKKLPGHNALLATNSSVLQYSLSTNLYASKDKLDAAYNLPQIDPWNGVRVSNTYWFMRARKADIIILHRGPIEAPAWTYTADVSGNWTFAQFLCRNNNYLEPLACEASLEHLLVNAALHATFQSFLPSLLHSLRTISEDKQTRSSLVIWHGSWYIQPLCAIAGLPKDIILLRDVWSNVHDQVFVDPWSLYYNTQVYIHDRLLRQILPHFKITYIPMAFPTYAGRPRFWFAGGHEEFSTSHVKDCILNPWPSFGKDVLEKSFFSSLSAILSNNDT